MSDEVTGEWIKLQTEEPCDLYIEPNICVAPGGLRDSTLSSVRLCQVVTRENHFGSVIVE